MFIFAKKQFITSRILFFFMYGVEPTLNIPQLPLSYPNCAGKRGRVDSSADAAYVAKAPKGAGKGRRKQ